MEGIFYGVVERGRGKSSEEGEARERAGGEEDISRKEIRRMLRKINGKAAGFDGNTRYESMGGIIWRNGYGGFVIGYGEGRDSRKVEGREW